MKTKTKTIYRPVQVWQFENEDTGSVRCIGILKNKPIHIKQGEWPETTGCASLPLEKQEYFYIKFQNKRWPVLFTELSIDKAHWWNEPGWKLTLASDIKITTKLYSYIGAYSDESSS